MVQRPRLRRIQEVAPLLLLLLFVASPSWNSARAVTDGYLPTGSSLEHLYAIDVSCRYADVSTHFAGTQILGLQTLDANTLSGCVTSNLSWDEGKTWLAMNATYSYAANRTYQNQNVSMFTAWWIDPAAQLGGHVSIQGDPPATDYFLREGPFQITDIVSLSLDSGHYTCWLLTYETVGGQQERFYYERWTGLLVAAYSQASLPMRARQMRLELQTATPLLPAEDLLTHLWLTFGPLLLPFSVAVLAAVGTYRVLHRLRGHRLQEWLGEESEHATHKSEPKWAPARPAEESVL